ncbi:hypothetical protein T09_9009 [Trichinella sp. T9]|nr:hypothetical protein T09_9009 [Trichinella sp. T9]
MDYARFHHNYVPYVVIDGWSRHILNSVVIAYGKEVSTKSKIFDAVVKASCIQQLMTDRILMFYYIPFALFVTTSNF